MRTPALFLAALAASASAAPRDFPFTWNTRVSKAGENGFEGWLTPRIERTRDFAQWDLRTAWVHGVTDSLESQLSMDLDITRLDSGESINPRFSSLWRWSTWRRPEQPLAFSGIARVSLGPSMFEAEARLVADVEVGRVLFSLNVSGSRAALWGLLTGVDTRLEESLGLRFQFAPFASLGLEGRVRSGWQGGDYFGTAIYVGPALTLTFERFWVSLGGHAQVGADLARADRALPEPLTLRDNERFVLRLAFGATAN